MLKRVEVIAHEVKPKLFKMKQHVLWALASLSARASERPVEPQIQPDQGETKLISYARCFIS